MIRPYRGLTGRFESDGTLVLSFVERLGYKTRRRTERVSRRPWQNLPETYCVPQGVFYGWFPRNCRLRFREFGTELDLGLAQLFVIGRDCATTSIICVRHSSWTCLAAVCRHGLTTLQQDIAEKLYNFALRLAKWVG
jgi:hypothetical protein